MSLLLCAVMTTGLFATQTVWADEETETADEDIDFSEDPYEVNMVILFLRHLQARVKLTE